MGFASTWLDQRALFPEFIKEPPDMQAGIIVVVPAFDEPNISPLLDSLTSCTEPDCGVEIIIVINAPQSASGKSIENNRKCISNILTWKESNSSFFSLFYIDTGHFPAKGWGVGMARKTGMDEALRRFNSIGRSDGVIVCLDADCTVEKNYFTAIFNELLRKKERTGCSVYFEHPVKGLDFPQEIYRYILQYELHLRYFVQGLRYCGFPYAFHTVGSALAVKAVNYLKAGGMNRRQAGEDFYFIQKLIPDNGFFALTCTTVYPSPRESFRVPFGTGAMMSKMMAGQEHHLVSYNIDAFRELNQLFTSLTELRSANLSVISSYYNSLPTGLRSFIKKEEWMNRILEIKENTSTHEAFLKRFFLWFNLFRVIKYMNHVHDFLFKKKTVTDSALDLLGLVGKESVSKESYRLLLFYREMDKESGSGSPVLS